MQGRTRTWAISLLVTSVICLLWLAPIPTTSSQSGTPSITSLSPSTVRAGGDGVTLVVIGAGFTNGALVRFDGSNRSTTFISSTTLLASIPAADISTVGTFPITVLNPNGSTSNASNLTVTPSVTNLSPLTVAIDSPAFTLTIEGGGFVNGSVVRWNGSNRTTTFVSSIKLTATISASDLEDLATVPVTVRNPSPNILTSNAINFKVTSVPPATECPAGADLILASPGKIDSGPARSQMWHNDNTWWGAFSNNSDGVYIYKRSSPTTWERGPLVHSNFNGGVFLPGQPDCLWSGTNLFILVQESIAVTKLYKYTYAAATQTYTLVSGFPISIPLLDVGDDGEGGLYGTIAIEQDGTGKLWAAYAGSGVGGDGNIRVIYSTSANHLTWNTTGFVLASGISNLEHEGTTITRFGGNKIGVAWSNTIAGEFGFRFHTDGQSETTWSTKQVIDSGLGPEGTGSVVKRHITMKGHTDGRVFFVGSDDDGVNGHLHLYVRTVAGVWGNKTLIVNNFNAMPGKPVLLLDTDNSNVHVIYKDGQVTTNGLLGQTFITQSSMTNPAFNTACLFVDTSDGEDTTVSTSNPTSTKQTINATTDLVVASSTGRSGNQILTNTVDITPNVLTVFSIAPGSSTANESTSALTMTVTGKVFNSNSSVRFNGSTTGVTTTFVNSGKLTASISASRINTANTYPVLVRNSTLDSNSKNFVVTATNPLPNVGLASPNRATVGSPQFTMSVHGSGFRRSSVVRFAGSNRTTQYISDTDLTATIPASDLVVAGSYPIVVFNPTPGGGTSTPTPITTFYVMPACSAPAGESLSGITLFNTVKSQMWYNDGFWWGAFSDNATGLYFYKQNGIGFTKGALLESNFNGRPDVLWNGKNLFVLVYEFNTLAQLYKYSYNTTTDTYSLISGFPINLPLTGIGPGISAAQTGSITIAQDSTGKLWAAYPGSFTAGDGNYRAIWSTSADHKTWNTTGHIFDTGGSVDTQEVSPIVHFGGNKIGIVSSKQPTKEIKFRYHVDGDPETTWSTEEIIDSGLGHLGLGGVADNHMSLKAAPDGRLFLAAKDSDGPGFISLYVRNAAGVWSAPVLIDVDPHAAVTRPVLVLDIENSEVYVFYADAISGFLYANKTSMNNPVFGPACPHVFVAGVSDVTTTKQNLTASTGLRAVGSTGSATSALHFNPLLLAAGTGNVPILNNISPTAAGFDSSAFTLTVSGSNFAPNAIVFIGGSDRPTTFVSSTQLTARIMSTDIQTHGTLPITVMNPKGGTSAAVNLAVSASISSLSPASALAGSPAFTLTVNGSGFVGGAVVRFNGLDRPTTFASTSQLTAQILASDVVTAGTPPVVVVIPGGAVSPASTFTVNNATPTLASISPQTQVAGAAGFTLAVTGSNFVNTSVVAFSGQPRATAFVSSTQLTAEVLGSDLLTTGSFPVTVSNPAPGGGSSAAMPLTVINPVPSISGLSPAFATMGGAGATLNVNGAGFVNGAVVRFNSIDRATTFVSGTQLTAQLTAADLSAPGSFPITVFNPEPGGGGSNQSAFAVNNGAPIVSSISPDSKLEGDAAFTLTVTGLDFVSGSVVRVNGSDRATTFGSSTQLIAQITAEDVQTAVTLAITVFNPPPGGGISDAVDLTVSNQVPTLTSINPQNKTVGDPAFLLTVNGTNFVNGSAVLFNGSNRSTTFVSNTQLTAQIDEADVQSTGNYPITIFNPAPGGGTSGAINLVVILSNPIPTVTTISPANIVAANLGFTLTVNGTNFVNNSEVRWNGQPRTTSFASDAQLTAQITAADIANAGTASVTVFNPTPGGGASGAVAFTVDPNPRVVSVTSSSAAANSIVTIPIQLTAQGDENALGFSLNYDPAVLSNPQATLGPDAAAATINSNSSQVALGRFGVGMSLPSGQNFAAGTRHIANVTFTLASVASETTTQVGFGDQPILREVVNSLAETLFAAYTSATITIVVGYEADVAPRPNGSNTGVIGISDWVQAGRFSAGIDTPDPGSEFQRADCAPRPTLGNGTISIADWVQAGRYAAGQEPVLAAGGPTGVASIPPQIPAATVTSDRASGDETDLAELTKVDLTSTILSEGQNSAVSIEFDAQGNENAFGFSLMFDPAKLRFVSAEKSSEASAATLNINQLAATNGRVGIALALPTGGTFAAGRHQLVVLNFTVVGETSEQPLIGFTDQPIAREVVDLNANPLKADFKDAAGVNPIEDAQFFVKQHYLDFLNRTPDAGGLDYWTRQITFCGTDADCIRQRRSAVSAAFFIEQEFQQTGFAVYRLYRAAYGRPPTYAEFIAARNQLLGGAQGTQGLANQFVTAPEFRQAYPGSLTATQFVNKLYETAGLSQSATDRLRAIQDMKTQGKTHSQVLLDLIETKGFKEREYNPAFVRMQYFGYLKRDPDQGGYDFWLNILNKEQGNYRGMVCSFITSREYQERFGALAPRSNQECGFQSRTHAAPDGLLSYLYANLFRPRTYTVSPAMLD